MRWLVFLLALLMISGLQAAEVKTVRTWSEPPRTRVVFDLSDHADYRVFTMRSPHRVVVDFHASRSRSRLALPDARSPNLRRLRYSTQRSIWYSRRYH